MKWFFLIAPGIYIVNIVVSSLFTRKYDDVIYKKNLYVWIFYLMFGVSQGVLNDNTSVDLQFKCIVWTFFMCMLLQSISVVISDVYKIKSRIHSDTLCYMLGLAVTWVLFQTIDNINLAVLPAVFFSAWPVLRLAPLLKKSSYNSFTKNGYLICALIMALHIVDYAYAVDKPYLIFPGNLNLAALDLKFIV